MGSEVKMVAYIVIREGAEPVLERHPDGIDAVQQLVGGSFEGWGVASSLVIYCHGEGRFVGLPPVRFWPRYGVIVGTHLVSRGDAAGETIDATEDDLALVRRVSLPVHGPKGGR